MRDAVAGLTFNTLRAGNIARIPTYKNKHGQRANTMDDGSDWSPAQWLQATIGELGEYANVRKKYERGDLNEAEFKAKAASELADVQVYLDILAFRLDIDLGQATIEKFNEVSVRVGSPIRIDAAGWHRAEDTIAVNPGGETGQKR